MLLPLSRSEVVAVLANGSVVRVSFSVCKKGIHADFFSIPVLNHLVGCLSQLGLFTVDSARRELCYVNKNRTIEIVAIDSLHHRFCDALPVSTLSFSRVGIVTVSEDRHDVYADTTLLFSTPYEIGRVAFYDDSQLLLTFNNSDGWMYLYDCTNPSLVYIIALTSMNLSVTPVYWKEMGCFLFAASSAGDLLLCSYQRLVPSTIRAPYCNKEHHRLSLGCGIITSLTCAGDTGLLVGDST
ncbi:hypothetical protein WA577_006820, partial [Blastocystis sp. JDR]